ncbi:uncharacterized protein TNIN_328961 [Trichonephila inaurata madagascariensis]|uniref:Granulins domain-containing protein n=1 Tax=Trichonephila inaurata madagascariensis TaxID=2747483 RepID=A0A8X7CDA5_9ARAC|nr:uncharacterized protein TNIN_328961 [Trichonephila inaurata madagascariensis]
MMGQNLKDLDIEICPDKLHLCPGTAECCKKDDGKWDCCPKAAVPIAGNEIAVINWDSSGPAALLLFPNATGGDAGGRRRVTH